MTPLRIDPETPLRRNLKNVILDGSLNRFKDPLLVIKSELGAAGSQSRTRSATRRHVVQIHIRDRAFELEQLYLDTFSACPTITSPDQRHTVSCSRSECSLTFHYRKDETDNQQRTLMVGFQVLGDLEAVIDRLRTCGVEVEVNPTESQGSSGFPLQPQQQVSYVPVPVEFAHQPNLYPGSPPPPITQGSQERDLRSPANRTLKSQPIEVTTPSQLGGQAQIAPKKRKRPVRGNKPSNPQTDDKRTKSARHSNKSSIPPGSKGPRPVRQAAKTKLSKNGKPSTMGLASAGSTATLSQPVSASLESVDTNEDADISSQLTIVMPPLVKSDDQIIQELMITHDVLAEATKVWKELKERGQTGTKDIGDLQEIQKIWVGLGDELVQRLHSRLIATVGELREARRQATGR